MHKIKQSIRADKRRACAKDDQWQVVPCGAHFSVTPCYQLPCTNRRGELRQQKVTEVSITIKSKRVEAIDSVYVQDINIYIRLK